MPAAQENWMEVGVVARPHGIRGWLRISLHDANSTALSCVSEIALGKPTQRFKLCAAEKNAGAYRVFLEGINDRDQAEKWRGSPVLIERDCLPALAVDEVYVSDLLGCEVLDITGKLIGVVEKTYFSGAHELLVVQAPDGEILIPFVPSMITGIDVEARIIHCDLPEGLYEINLPQKKAAAPREK